MEHELTTISGFVTLTVVCEAGIFQLQLPEQDYRRIRSGVPFCVCDDTRYDFKPQERLLWSFNSCEGEQVLIQSEDGSQLYCGSKFSVL